MAPWYESMTSSVKPRVYVTCRNAVREGPSHSNRQRAQKDGEVRRQPTVFQLRECRADRQTDRHAHHNTLHPSPGAKNIHVMHWAFHSHCTMNRNASVASDKVVMMGIKFTVFPQHTIRHVSPPPQHAPVMTRLL